MKKFILVLFMVGILLVSGVFTALAQEKVETIHLTIGTASVGGAWYPIGMQLAKLWNDKVPGAKAVPQATAGSPQNIELLRNGEIQLCLNRSKEVFEAYNGIGKYEGKKATFLRVLVPLYCSGKEVLALKDSGIESIADFRGKKIAVGPIGSGGYADALEYLTLYGMTFDDIKPEFVEAGQAVDMMKDGMIQGAFLGLTTGSSSVIELMMTGRVKLLLFEEDKLQELFKDNPTYSRFVIEAGTYPNQDYDVITHIAGMDIVATHENMDEETAYNLVKAMYENPDAVREAHAILAQWKPELVATDLPIPYHPGAEKFWKEVGIRK